MEEGLQHQSLVSTPIHVHSPIPIQVYIQKYVHIHTSHRLYTYTHTQRQKKNPTLQRIVLIRPPLPACSAHPGSRLSLMCVCTYVFIRNLSFHKSVIEIQSRFITKGTCFCVPTVCQAAGEFGGGACFRQSFIQQLVASPKTVYLLCLPRRGSSFNSAQGPFLSHFSTLLASS